MDNLKKFCSHVEIYVTFSEGLSENRLNSVVRLFQRRSFMCSLSSFFAPDSQGRRRRHCYVCAPRVVE